MKLLGLLQRLSQNFGSNPTDENKLRMAELMRQYSREVQSMSEMQGWKVIDEDLNKELRKVFKEIYKLSEEPELNKFKLARLRGMSDGLILTLATVNNWKNVDKNLENIFKEIINKQTKREV